MAQYVRMVYDGYRDLMDNKSDPRVNDWFLMSSPFPTLLICLSYAYIVKVLGPKLMENRKPFDLRKVMIWYNLFEVVFSTWLFHESLAAGWGGDYSFRCQPVDYSRSPKAMRMANGCWWYFFSKFIEFADTIFFVLRKKNDHISKLHVIHHGIMPMSVWFGVKFSPGGHSSFFGLLNTFVHMVMYTYYLLAALGPRIQPYLWWKKYLTSLQMIQFVLVMIHAFQLLFIECNYPKAFVWWIGMHAVLFYFLFRDFYKQAYSNKAKREAMRLKQQQQKKKAEENGGVVVDDGINHDVEIIDKIEEEEDKNAEDGTRSRVNGKVKSQNGSVYPSQYKMATAYTSDSGLRNRVFIDNRGSTYD